MRRGRHVALLAAVVALAAAAASAQPSTIPPAISGAPAVRPAALLDEAIGLLRRHHINTASADWARIAAAARQRIAGAAQTGGAHDAIQYVIDQLGERHTFLLSTHPAARRAGASDASPMPSYERVGSRFGLVRLPGFAGPPAEADRYRDTLRAGLLALDRQGVCGWIVDLRGNPGGNMWPMLNGLDPLLGPDPFGYFRAPSGRPTPWVRNGGMVQGGERATGQPPAFRLRRQGAPVAVLLGPRTGSSGEMTAIAFAGRARMRSFGAPTAGFTTANQVFPLADGSVLVITTAYARDRTGHEYRGPMVPDEAVADAQAAALHWLRSQRCR